MLDCITNSLDSSSSTWSGPNAGPTSRIDLKQVHITKKHNLDTCRNSSGPEIGLGAKLGPPSAITIARSATDGFTPADQVESLLERVIQWLKESMLPLWNALDKINNSTPSFASAWTPGAEENSSAATNYYFQSSQRPCGSDALAGENSLVSLEIYDLCVDDVYSTAFKLFLHPRACDHVDIHDT